MSRYMLTLALSTMKTRVRFVPFQLFLARYGSDVVLSAEKHTL